MSNAYTRQGWSDGASGWVRNEALFDAVFTPVTAAILDAARLGPGQRALDVGCGSGTLLEAGVAAGAVMVGIDISADMVEAARHRVPQADVVLGDAQRLDLLSAAPGAPFDRVISRFGVMFFEDPAQAFANLRAATAPRAGLTFACWRGLEENPTFTLGTDVLTSRLESPPPPPVPGKPGPVAFADPDWLTSLLAGAGWTEVQVEPLDVICDHGIDGSDGVEERLAMLLATTTGRLAREELEPRLSAEEWAALLDDVRAELRRHLVDGVVRFPAATWLVTAANA